MAASAIAMCCACAWEVEEAARLGKCILPVNCRPLESASTPPRLWDLNYIFFYEDPKVSDSGFGTGLASLVSALHTDFDWLREHPLPSARNRVGQGWPASAPATIRRRYCRRKGIGGAPAQECARAHRPSPRLHPRERRGGAGAIERRPGLAIHESA
jgi:hypothetical protein